MTVWLASHARNGNSVGLSVVLALVLIGAPRTYADSNTATAPVTVTSQTSFGAEERFEQMVPIPPGALAILRPELLELRCALQAQHGDGLSASAVALEGDASPALLVSGGTCIFANAAPFWVLRPQTGGAWARVLQTAANELRLLDTKTRGLRDLKTLKAGSSGELSTTWQFDGAAYKKATCERRGFDTNDRWRMVTCLDERPEW